MQPTIPALVNDLAPDHLRGRYNAVSTAAFSLAAIIAPVIAGWLIGHGLGDLYIGQLVVGCGAVVLVAIRLERDAAAGRQRRTGAGARGDPGQRTMSQMITPTTTTAATACFQ